jgi:hypothetical protein
MIEALEKFDYENLAPHIQEMAKPFYDIAYTILTTSPDNFSRYMALHHLREARNEAIMARYQVTV